MASASYNMSATGEWSTPATREAGTTAANYAGATVRALAEAGASAATDAFTDKLKAAIPSALFNMIGVSKKSVDAFKVVKDNLTLFFNHALSGIEKITTKSVPTVAEAEAFGATASDNEKVGMAKLLDYLIKNTGSNGDPVVNTSDSSRFSIKKIYLSERKDAPTDDASLDHPQAATDPQVKFLMQDAGSALRRIVGRAHRTAPASLGGAAFTASSLRAGTGGSLGSFRWILWQTAPVTGIQENTAWQELIIETAR